MPSINYARYTQRIIIIIIISYLYGSFCVVGYRVATTDYQVLIKHVERPSVYSSARNIMADD